MEQAKGSWDEETSFIAGIFVSLKSESTGEIIEIDQDEFIIGRALECDYTIAENKSVGRQHARLSLEDRNCFLEDLDSLNGTYVNGERVLPGEKRRLFHGDIAQLSDEAFEVSVRLERPELRSWLEKAWDGTEPESVFSGAASDAGSQDRSLERVMSELGESFHERLFGIIDGKGLSDVEVYKRAKLDRKLFSRIRCNPDYQPRKRTVAALALALELSVQETAELLQSAGLAFSRGCRFDLILLYCLENGIYEITTVNEYLHDYGQPLLGE